MTPTGARRLVGQGRVMGHEGRQPEGLSLSSRLSVLMTAPGDPVPSGNRPLYGGRIVYPLNTG